MRERYECICLHYKKYKHHDEIHRDACISWMNALGEVGGG